MTYRTITFFFFSQLTIQIASWYINNSYRYLPFTHSEGTSKHKFEGGWEVYSTIFHNAYSVVIVKICVFGISTYTIRRTSRPGSVVIILLTLWIISQFVAWSKIVTSLLRHHNQMRHYACYWSHLPNGMIIEGARTKAMCNYSADYQADEIVP